MPDPRQHADQRGIIESIGRKIPGFGGYLESESRRQSDALLRQWVADKLQKSKSGLDDYARNLVDLGQIDGLQMVDRLKARVDKAIGRIEGAVAGYSSLFGFVTIDADKLDEVYDHDLAMADMAAMLADEVHSLSSQSAPASMVLPPLLNKVDEIDEYIDRRTDILKGLEG